MKSFLSLLLFEIKRNLNEPYTLIMFIFVPAMLTFVLGTTFDSVLSSDMGLESLYLLYVEEDEPVGEALVDYLDNEEISRFIQYEKTADPDAAREQFKDEKYMGYIILEGQAGEDLFDGKPVTLIFTSKYNGQIIEGLLSGFSESAKLAMTYMEEGQGMPTFVQGDVLTRGKFNADNEFPEAIDYYAIQSLLQMLVFASILGSNALTRDYMNDAFIRIGIAPISRFKLLSSIIVGNAIYVTVAAFISLMVSKYVFGANIEGNWFLIMTAIVLFAFMLVGIGIIIGSLIKNLVASIGVTIGIMMFFSSVSGALTPEATSDVLQLFTPNYYAKNIIFGAIYGYDQNLIINSIVAMLIGIVGVYVINILLQRRKAI